MPNPTCATTCDGNLAVVDFDNCNPVVAFSEIRRIFVAKRNAAPFTDWTQASEWLSRISEDSVVGNDYIRALTVIGDKPVPTPVLKDLSNGRKYVVGKDHVINFTIDDVSDDNYEFMRQTECGGEFRFWYETEGGYMYGGNSGIVARYRMDDQLNRGREEIALLLGVIEWRSKFSPERAISPIYDGNSASVIPQSFDTVQTFAADTDDTDHGVTTTVPATDADLQFEFNAINPRVGTPMTMTIKIATVTVATVDFTSDYEGEYFRFTSTAGTEYVGNFYNGEVNFS